MGSESGREGRRFHWLDLLGREVCEKLLDTANLALGGLVIAQFLGSGGFNWRLALLGWALWTAFFGAAGWLLYLQRGRR